LDKIKQNFRHNQQKNLFGCYPFGNGEKLFKKHILLSVLSLCSPRLRVKSGRESTKKFGSRVLLPEINENSSRRQWKNFAG